MEVKKVIGIDVSKNTLDCCFLSQSGSHHIQISNNIKGFKVLEKWLIKTHGVQYNEALFCMEHTGLYNNPFLHFLSTKETGIWLESAIHIKRSMGLVRGKNDKVDAQRIAQYAIKNMEQMQQWQPKRPAVEKVKALLSLRDNMIMQIKQINAPLNELKTHGDKETVKLITQHSNGTRNALEQGLKKIETSIMTLIQEDESLKRLYAVLSSIIGVGKVTAWLFIVHTNEFKHFTNPRSLACHSGVAPFENSSGLWKGKAKVSHMANKRLKTALHMASMTAVKLDPELKSYYERKVEEGKNKMSVLNAVRNKLVHRIFACQKQDKLYIPKTA